MQIEFIDDNSIFLEDVKALGRKHSSTLGFMPEGGFEDHAKKKCIIIASDESELIGYLMFRVVSSNSRVSIVHLCINEGYRKKNIPILLLDELRRKYENLFAGILLSCRADYSNATSIWQKYGFICKGKVRSRSVEENFLYKWWYDFNKADLFSISDSNSTKIKALLDANIIIKLRDNEAEQEPSQDPRALLADWLVTDVDYYYAPEILNEITRDSDNHRVEKTRIFLTNFFEARLNIEYCKSIATHLNEFIKGKTDNDKSDRKQLASCIAAEIPYFITFDQGFLDARYEIEQEYDIQIFSPQEFIIEIDGLFNKNDYAPVKLSGVTFHSTHQVSNIELESCIDKFLQKPKSEKKLDFRNIVLLLTSNIQNSKIKVIKSGTETIAFFGYNYLDEKINVPFIRLADTEFRETLFMQLVSDFIDKAIKEGFTKICIKEKYLSDSQKSILEKLGFGFISEEWRKDIIHKLIDSLDLLQDIHFKKESYLFEPLQTICLLDNTNGNKQDLLLSIERKLFPLKFVDLDIPCYIVPIKPYWAGQLFEQNISNVMLFGAEPNKIWNRENIYYRSVRPISEKAPARILWYVSDDNKSIRRKAITATSYLDEVMVDLPKKMFQQNKRFGTYVWEDIYKLCHNNINEMIKTLRFSDTELFKNPIPLTQINKILNSNGRKPNTFASPVKVESCIFNEIYQQGTWKK